MRQFVEYLQILNGIERWGNFISLYHEDDGSHTFIVATIAHLIGAMQNAKYGSDADLGDVALRAIYHDIAESITGDIISAAKRKTPEMLMAARKSERLAAEALLDMLPSEIRTDYSELLLNPKDMSLIEGRIVEAADVISAYLKARMEVRLGNTTYAGAVEKLRDDSRKHVEALPAVRDILEAIETEDA